MNILTWMQVLKGGGDPNAANNKKTMPLMNAAHHGHDAAVECVCVSVCVCVCVCVSVREREREQQEDDAAHERRPPRPRRCGRERESVCV